MSVFKKTLDPVTVALNKAGSATNLFAQAKDQVDSALGLFDGAIEIDKAAIQDLKSRISNTQAHHANSKKISDKLAEFVV